MKISKTNCNFERQVLSAPFGFKGGYLSELWQSVVLLENGSGQQGVGLGTQSTLWSDAEIFINNTETAGNEMMFMITEFAAEYARKLEWDNPLQLLDQLLGPTYEYGKKITRNQNLRLTFALNALVAVDNAAWLIYCKEKNITNFDDMIPEDIRDALPVRHEKLACIPLMSYGVGIDDITEAVEEGYFFLKVKIGCDPDGDGDLDKMVEWDKQRLSDIHEAVKNVEIEYTDSGHIPYYLDANGRYDSKKRLLELLAHAERIGALDRIILFEEPFAEEFKEDVCDIPVRLAADESAHSDKDAAERIEMGYGAIALKPIAKTMSMSFKIAKIAHDKNIPCFCADLTVNPILVDWNKVVAARLPQLPGMKIGLLESNGHQNYRDWEAMKKWHPCAGALWRETKKGLYELNEDFYNQSGGIFEISKHYKELVRL